MVAIPKPKGVGDTLTPGKILTQMFDCYTTENFCGKQIVLLPTNPSFGHILLNELLHQLLVCNKPTVDNKAYHYFPGKIYSISHDTDLSKSIHETSV